MVWGSRLTLVEAELWPVTVLSEKPHLEALEVAYQGTSHQLGPCDAILRPPVPA